MQPFEQQPQHRSLSACMRTSPLELMLRANWSHAAVVK